jgi:hypothetical protein
MAVFASSSLDKLRIRITISGEHLSRPTTYFRRLLKESAVAVHHERPARAEGSAQVVAQMGRMPVSGDASVAKYCRSHIAVGRPRIPPVKDLQHAGKARRSLIRWIKTGAKATVRDHVGKPFNGLYPRGDQSA